MQEIRPPPTCSLCCRPFSAARRQPRSPAEEHTTYQHLAEAVGGQAGRPDGGEPAEAGLAARQAARGRGDRVAAVAHEARRQAGSVAGEDGKHGCECVCVYAQEGEQVGSEQWRCGLIGGTLYILSAEHDRRGVRWGSTASVLQQKRKEGDTKVVAIAAC